MPLRSLASLGPASLLSSLLVACSPAAPAPATPAGSPTASSSPAASSTTATPPSPRPPLAWREVTSALRPGHLALSSEALFFADPESLWRCVDRRCDRFGLQPSAARALPLDCPLSRGFTTSRSGRVLAFRCASDLVVLRTDGTLVRKGPIPLDTQDLAVDDRGEVTMTAPLGGARWAIVRQPPRGDATRIEVTSSARGALSPGVGELLAWTTGNSSHEAAWIGPQATALRIEGLSFVNGEQLWVSFEKGGYARRQGTTLVPVQGSPRGGLPPHGILMTSDPWGPAGMMFVYERAVLLTSPELETVHQVELPRLTLTLQALGSSFTTDRVRDVLATPDGRTLLAILADGSALAWGPLSP